jgi:heme-degrading monooxygenase HmoA
MFHLAQVNIARARFPLTDPAMHGFVSRLAEINSIAESSPGFVWRFKDDVEALDDRTVFNMSIWESVEALKEFTYRSTHCELFRDRHQWFERLQVPSLAMWWLAAGHVPTVAEAKARLDHIRDHGETAFAFTFRNLFPAPELDRAQNA